MSVDYLVQGLTLAGDWKKVYGPTHKGRAQGFVDALLRVSPRPAIRIQIRRDGRPDGNLELFGAQPVRRKAGGHTYDDAGDLLEHLLAHQQYNEKVAELERREDALLAGEARLELAPIYLGGVK